MDPKIWLLSLISPSTMSPRMPMADDPINAQSSCSVSFPRGTALVLMGGLIYLC